MSAIGDIKMLHSVAVLWTLSCGNHSAITAIMMLWSRVGNSGVVILTGRYSVYYLPLYLLPLSLLLFFTGGHYNLSPFVPVAPHVSIVLKIVTPLVSPPPKGFFNLMHHSSEPQMRGPLYFTAQRCGAWSHVPHL